MTTNDNMNFYCKSSLDYKQLKHRTQLLTDGIELQLLNDFVTNPRCTQEYLFEIGENVSQIKAVHIPLDKFTEYSDLQSLNNPEQRDILERTCALAQQISIVNNRSTLVVIHNLRTLEELKEDENSFESICSFIYYLLIKFPSIKIGIENVTPLLYRQSSFRNGCYPSYTEVIRELRTKLDTDRIGSVLDTCHALTTIRVLDLIYSAEKLEYHVCLKDYFKENKDICFLVHLANVENLGIKEKTHGTSFDKHSTSLLREIMELYNDFLNNTPITIEVIEDDYMNCLNYEKTRNLISTIK